MGREAATNRVEVLGPLRGIAALAVTWYHLTGSPQVTTGWLRQGGTFGFHGVEAFFVISGFVIPYSMYCGGYRPRLDFLRFFAKRLVRLEPPYLASIVFVLALSYLSALRPGAALPEFTS